jgi:hypothetical protein
VPALRSVHAVVELGHLSVLRVQDEGAGMTEQTVWHIVADVTDPHSEPFMVVRVDTTSRCGNGCEGEIISLHWTRDEAKDAADLCQAKISGEVN